MIFPCKLATTTSHSSCTMPLDFQCVCAFRGKLSSCPANGCLAGKQTDNYGCLRALGEHTHTHIDTHTVLFISRCTTTGARTDQNPNACVWVCVPVWVLVCVWVDGVCHCVWQRKDRVPLQIVDCDLSCRHCPLLPYWFDNSIRRWSSDHRPALHSLHSLSTLLAEAFSSIPGTHWQFVCSQEGASGVLLCAYLT